MQFFEPSRLALLWLLPVVLLFVAAGERLRRRRLARLGNVSFLEKRLMPDYSSTKRRLGALLLVLVFLFCVIALARPQWGEEKKQVERKGLDIIFLLDTSLSMLAQDAQPDRLRKSKLEIKSLIRRFEGHRVGMVAFAGTSFLQSPLTLDYSAFLLFVDALVPGYLPNPGTSLARAVELGIRAFPKENRKYRVMVIFSDGEDHEGGVEQALEEAKKAGVRVYAIGVGTSEGEPIPLRSASDDKVTGYKKDSNGQVIITRLNRDLLERVGRETGGLYLPATPAEKEIDVLLKHLETMGERKLKTRLIREREDHFQFFLLIAFLFFILENLLGDRKKGLVTLPLLFMAFSIFTGFFNSPKDLVEKGNQNVEGKRYQSAVENYRKAQISRPDNPVIRYNLGTALYELYQYRDAEKELEQAISHAKDNEAKARTLYNYGNTQYRLGDFEKAIESYKKVLELKPKDEDAKYNLEFLQKKKSLIENKQERKKNQEQQKDQQNEQNKQQKQEQKEQDQKQQQQRERQDDKEQEEQRKKGQEQEDEMKQDQQEQDEEEKQQEQEEKNQGRDEGNQQEQSQGSGTRGNPLEGSGLGQQPLQGQMTKEDAQRILDALMDNERGLQDIRRPHLPVKDQNGSSTKDW